MIGVGRGEGGLGRDLNDLQHPLVDQALDDPGRNPGGPGQIGGRQNPSAQGVQHRRPRRGSATRLTVFNPSHPAFGPGAGRTQPFQGSGGHLARRAQGPARGPLQELQSARRQGRIVDQALYLAQASVRAGRLAHLCHDAAHPARPQGHCHLITRPQVEPIRHLIVKGFMHWHRDQDRSDFHAVSPAARSCWMKLFLDTADVTVIREMVPTGLVDGVTTNPSLIAKSGRNIAEVIAEICALVEGPISAEAVATDYDTMVREGEHLAQIAPNVVVKLPLTWDGLRATRTFADRGIKTNVTLCFSGSQALLAAKAGATFISPFVGRLEDHGADGIGLLEEIRVIYDNGGYDTQILAASLRNATHVAAAAVAGSDAATLPPDVFKACVKHPLTDKGLEAFLADWGKTGQSIL